MNNQIKAKVTRQLFASLLNSNLTNKEIIQFCDSILSGSPYIHELASTIKQQIENNHLFGIDALDEDELNTEIEEVYSEIRSRRISKHEILQRIEMYGFNFYDKYHNKGNIKSILKDFILSSNEDIWTHFKDSILPDGYFKRMGDKYL